MKSLSFDSWVDQVNQLLTNDDKNELEKEQEELILVKKYEKQQKVAVCLPESTKNVRVGLKRGQSHKFGGTDPTLRLIVLGNRFSQHQELHIDAILMVSKWAWRKSDALDYRYHVKRAVYLARLARLLIDAGLARPHPASSYLVLHSRYLSPLLQVSPTGLDGVVFEIGVSWEEGGKQELSVSRLAPERCNIRQAGGGEATPVYNARVLAERWLVRRVRAATLEAVCAWTGARPSLVNVLPPPHNTRALLTHIGKLAVDVDGWEGCRARALAAVRALSQLHAAADAPPQRHSAAPNMLYYDHIISWSGNEVVDEVLAASGCEHGGEGACVEREACALRALTACVRRALGPRAALVEPLPTADRTLPLIRDAAVQVEPAALSIGIILDPQRANDPVERGPEPNSPEAIQFRLWWGSEVCGVHRWPDGAITEAVCWPDTTDLTHTIIQHALSRHYGSRCSDSGRWAWAGWGEAVVRGARDEAHALASLTRLRRAFTMLPHDALPIPVSSIHVVSSIALWQPGAPLSALMQLEESGGWPRDETAVRAVLAALYVRVARVLRSRDQLRATATHKWVEVECDGVVWRLAGARPGGLRTAGDQLLATLRSHLRSMAGVSGCARLVRRWLGRHLAAPGGLRGGVLCELMAAHARCAAAGTATQQPAALLARALHTLATADFRAEPLLPDSDAMRQDHMERLEHVTKMMSSERERALLPPLVCLTAYDGDELSPWTRDWPTAPELRRIQKLAAVSLAHLENAYLTGSLVLIPGIVASNTQGFDVILRLRELNQREREAAQTYVEQLQSGYGEWALFLWDSDEGSEVGVLWRPPAPPAPRRHAFLEDFHLLGTGLLADVTVNT